MIRGAIQVNFVKEILTPLRVLKQKSIYNIANIRGVAVGNRKILVIESDDWGSIRVPSKMVHDKLNRVGANLDVDPFTKYDGLERVEDLQKLFSVLKQYVDCKGNHPIVTPFYVMRNADFSAIINCEYRKFYDESFLCTYKKYGEDPEMVLKTIQEGINDRVFIPELHCLEHLNVYAWMRDLQNGNEDTRLACKNGMYGLGTNFRDDNLYGYMDAFHNRYEEQIKEYECMIKTAVCDFESIMGYSPVAFTAPCYIWDPKIEEYLYTNGLKYLCGANYQLIPIAPHYETFKKNSHHMGQKNLIGQRYLNRNVDLELMYGWKETPSIALRQIEAAFSQHKPAVISIHRANFTTRVSEESSAWVLEFEKVLQECLKRWPSLEFMSSRDLGRMYDEINRQSGEQ